MKSLVLLIVFVSVFSLNAQVTSIPKITLQFIGGVENTGEHVGPFYPLICVEGCVFKEQIRKRSTHVELGAFYNFSERHALRLGVGISQIKFTEIWLGSDGASEPIYPFERPYSFSFASLMLGHNYSFLNGDRLSVFLQNNMVLDFVKKQDENYPINKMGVSYKGLLGMTYAMNEKVKLQSNLFYKTAFAKYDDLGTLLHSNGISGYKFMPFALGLELGISVSL